MNNNKAKVRLRAIEPEDLDLLYRIENDMKLWNVGASNVPYSRYTLHDYIANAADDIYVDRQVRMMVENEEGEIVGIVDVVNFDPGNCRAEVGLIILDAYRRRGYGSSTLQQIADYALNVLHLHQLFAFVDMRNEGSMSLFGKMGYVAAVKIKDWLYDGREYRDAALMQLVF
ncbi:diamine N-acetyltransferase [Prevotella sp. khp7]|uniref:GNAT family N-acetyltransferase n=1 Tax=Prevotella sp. khp7 TaxID=1761885 RepID=UPI0008CC9F14|nr:GNAT family N-acetyltransferase [Prevotella sp. khp7]SEV82750.1 diamine N-acetyltransferase [Prevotella sp. khp7]